MSDICRFTPPAWLHEFGQARAADHYADDDSRIELAIALSALSIDHGGGPFGAALFNHRTGQLVSAGCNLVMLGQCSHWHAEMVAILLAQETLAAFDLGGLPFTLATSCEPCVMCLGATLWSGVGRLVAAASDADARAIGFDEGPKPVDWVAALHERGVEVVTGLRRDSARRQLQRYRAQSGVIY